MAPIFCVTRINEAAPSESHVGMPQYAAVHCRQSLLWKAAGLLLHHTLLWRAAQRVREAGRTVPQLPHCAQGHRHSSCASPGSCECLRQYATDQLSTLGTSCLSASCFMQGRMAALQSSCEHQAVFVVHCIGCGNAFEAHCYKAPSDRCANTALTAQPPLHLGTNPDTDHVSSALHQAGTGQCC